MYNRTSFNRAAYNRAAFLVFEWTAKVYAAAEATAKITASFQVGGRADASSDGAGTVHIRFVLPHGLSEAKAEAIGNYIRRLFMEGVAHALAASGGSGVSVYEVLTLAINDVNMAAGDLLFIDTANMVVTLNGVNIVDKIADGSTFFRLQSGKNDVSVDGDGLVDVTVLWKDRWL